MRTLISARNGHIDIEGGLGPHYAGTDSGRGNASGSETTGTNAVVHATGHLSYSNGSDTVLTGTRLEGESVTGRTGGKLIITSPQDTGIFTSQQNKRRRQRAFPATSA